ncbi:MAG: hypothetical protein H0X35_04350 [Pseudonocardiales bacterium]|nr:hypothetical protein [Pseudonocardiales bacterium]
MRNGTTGSGFEEFEKVERWRSRADAEHHLAKAIWRVEHPDPMIGDNFNAHNTERFGGVRDALAWVLGDTDTAPITRRYMPVRGDVQVCNEWFYGLDVIERRQTHQPPNGLTFIYCEAATRALNWFRGLGDYEEPADYEY